MQLVSVTPGIRYKMAGALRVQELRGGFAYLQLAFLDAYGALMEDASVAPKSEMLTEPCDYREESLEALAPAGAAMAEVRACISGKGTFYVKNIMFTQA